MLGIDDLSNPNEIGSGLIHWENNPELDCPARDEESRFPDQVQAYCTRPKSLRTIGFEWESAVFLNLWQCQKGRRS